MVGTNTVVTPGSDAAVLRVRGLEAGTRGLHRRSRTVRSSSTRTSARPEQSPRRLATSPAAARVRSRSPTASTSPIPSERPIYFQLSESIRGMSDACRAFHTPVVSGNASLYNESEDGPVTPTPVVGMLGIIADVRQAVRMAFRDEGDEVWLLGGKLDQNASTLGGSEYLAVLHGKSAGPIDVDLEAEAALVETLVAGAEAGVLKSAHDCSDGGLAVALSESAIVGEVGVVVEIGEVERLDAALFGESGGRAVVSVNADQAQRLATIASRRGVVAARIGTVGGDRIEIGRIGLGLATASDAWSSALAALLDG